VIPELCRSHGWGNTPALKTMHLKQKYMTGGHHDRIENQM